MKQINIFGSSEKLLELEDVKILQILKSCESIGINNFGLKYPTDYILFSDTPIAEIVANNGTEQKILTNYFNYRWYFKDKPEFKVAGHWEPNSIEGSISNSAFYALWWAVKTGYTHINLYGIMDSDHYPIRANGSCRVQNIYSKNGETLFALNEVGTLKRLIENGFNNKVIINRPLLNKL